MGDDEVIRFLKEKLAAEEEILRKLEVPLDTQREKVRRLRASLAAQQTGTFGSRSISDAEIVEFLRRNSSAPGTDPGPMSASRIAEGMELDTRGLSRRLPRMAKDRLIHGSPDEGYWVE
jgi:predicted nucleic acid-binding Zn ribbon protein